MKTKENFRSKTSAPTILMKVNRLVENKGHSQDVVERKVGYRENRRCKDKLSVAIRPKIADFGVNLPSRKKAGQWRAESRGGLSMGDVDNGKAKEFFCKL